MHDQISVVAAEVVAEQRNLEHHTAAFVTQIVRRANVVASHVIMVMNFAPIVLLLDEWADFVVTDAAHFGRIVYHVLILIEQLISAVRFKVLG